MFNVLLVGIGGFTGAVLRYLLGGFVQNLSSTNFPYGTMTVNIIGCFLIGILSRLAELHPGFTPEYRLIFIVGLLGSFTTYSTFSNDSLSLFQNDKLIHGLTYMGIHIFIGLLAVYLGHKTILSFYK